MEEINQIYANSFGISFRWKNASTKNTKKTQIIFRDTGIFLDTEEIKKFSNLINSALKRVHDCGKCPYNDSCKSLLLESPFKQINFAVNYKELTNIDDLIKGTLFNIEFNNILEKNIIKKSTS